MGRRKRREETGEAYLPDKPYTDVSTPEEFEDWTQKSNGMVAEQVYQQNLAEYNERGQLVTTRARVEEAVNNLRGAIVESRQVDREYYLDSVQRNLGQGGRRTAENAMNRTYQARAEAIRLAARASGVSLTAAQKRVLTPLAQGGYLTQVYGKKDQYAAGTFNADWRKRAIVRAADPAYQARAEEKARILREYRYGDRR